MTINPRQIETNHPYPRALQDVAITVMAILNDSTGTLMSCAHSNHNCRIGVIIGKTFCKVSSPTATSNEPHFLGGSISVANWPPIKQWIDWKRFAAGVNSKFFELYPHLSSTKNTLRDPLGNFLFYVVIVFLSYFSAPNSTKLF